MDSENNVPESGKKNKVHKCTFEGCNAAFYRPYRLKDHLAKHVGTRPYSCDVTGCEKTYTNVSHLKRHKVTYHEEKTSKPQEIMCTHNGCSMFLKNKYSLQKHLRVHDESRFPFTCTECPQKFKKKKHLNQHIAFHKGEAVHRCESCDIGFISAAALKKHMGNHKTYLCDCGDSFDRWSKFCKHRKSCITKKVHQCVICEKTFSTAMNLKSHTLTHVEESQRELFRCHYLNCTRSYSHKRNLTHHIKYFHEKFAEDIRIKCTQPNCDKEFRSKLYLKRHLANIHVEIPKVKKPRKPRKDKGKKKKSAAATLSGIELTRKEHLEIINNSNRSTEIVENRNEPDVGEETVDQTSDDDCSLLSTLRNVWTQNCLMSSA